MELNLHQTYFKNFTNKIAVMIPQLYIDSVFMIKKCNEESSQQFALDLIELKNAVLEFTNLPDSKGQKKKIPKTFLNLVKKSFDKVDY